MEVPFICKVFSSVDFYSAFGVHRVFGAFSCCGGPLCLRWWGGPDFVFHGIVEEEWGWDVDTMSYIDFMKLINSLGYKSFKCLWYRDPRKELSRGLKPLNCDSDILQLAEDFSGFDVVEVYVDQGVFEKSAKKLNNVKGDEVEAEVQVDEQGLVEVQVQGEDEAGVVGEMEVVVEGVVEDDVEIEENDDDRSDCSEVSDNDFKESWDWTKSLDP
ncbi:hypothetical protein HKD37_01G001320 [Glycine soja]